MVFCPNCKQEDCSLLKGRNGELWQLEDDLNRDGLQSVEKNIVVYTAYICNVCGNFFAIGESHVGSITND